MTKELYNTLNTLNIKQINQFVTSCVYNKVYYNENIRYKLTSEKVLIFYDSDNRNILEIYWDYVRNLYLIYSIHCLPYSRIDFKDRLRKIIINNILE